MIEWLYTPRVVFTGVHVYSLFTDCHRECQSLSLRRSRLCVKQQCNRYSVYVCVPGEVWWDRSGDKRLHWFPVNLLEHEQDLWTLRDQLALTARTQLWEENTFVTNQKVYKHLK